MYRPIKNFLSRNVTVLELHSIEVRTCLSSNGQSPAMASASRLTEALRKISRVSPAMPSHTDRICADATSRLAACMHRTELFSDGEAVPPGYALNAPSGCLFRDAYDPKGTPLQPDGQSSRLACPTVWRVPCLATFVERCDLLYRPRKLLFRF